MMKKWWAVFVFLFFTQSYLCSYELGIITLFRNEANFLKEWIEYHHMLGVDHFLLYNDRSTDDWQSVLEPYIQSNLVEVFEWSKDDITPLFPTWQLMAYKDGLRRSQGNTKWLAFIDVDEFIRPEKNATILECLNQYYPNASGIYACWRNFGTGGVYVNPGETILDKLTSCSDLYHPQNASGKSIVRADAVMIDRCWSPHHHVLQSGAQYYDGAGNPLFFEGDDLKVNPRHTSGIIRIHHYVMRDENFYQTVRVPRAISREYGYLPFLQEQYAQFNLSHDHQMITFLKTRHPEMCKKLWPQCLKKSS